MTPRAGKKMVSTESYLLYDMNVWQLQDSWAIYMYESLWESRKKGIYTQNIVTQTLQSMTVYLLVTDQSDRATPMEIQGNNNWEW